jgi:hypothetical protein
MQWATAGRVLPKARLRTDRAAGLHPRGSRRGSPAGAAAADTSDRGVAAEFVVFEP